MTAKILSFKIPDRIKRYQDPDDFLIDIENFEFDVRKTLGTIGKMIQDHRFLVLNTIRYGDYMKPYKDWTGITKHHVVEQRDKFNTLLSEAVRDVLSSLFSPSFFFFKVSNFFCKLFFRFCRNLTSNCSATREGWTIGMLELPA